MIAYEGAKTGIGLGIASEPLEDYGVPGGPSTKVIPMFYLRVGRLQKVHGFVESGPAAPGGPPERVRLGIGSGWGERHHVGLRASIGAAAFPNGGAADFALLVSIPVARRLDLGFAGTYRDPNGGNVGIFGRANWGAPPRPE